MGTGGDIQHLFFIKSEQRTNTSENKNTKFKIMLELQKMERREEE